MKCEVVRDLLPLYDEKLCSEESAALVEEHLKTCDACRSLLEKLPKAEIVEAEASDIKPFVKVKQKLRKRIVLLIILGVVLLAVLIPVGYLTVNQIFHINGGTDFQDLIYRHEMREFAEMIVEGRMEEYTQRYANLHIGDAPDGTSITYRSFYLEKLNAAYEKVKKYDPRIGEIHCDYSNHNGKVTRWLDLTLEFTRDNGDLYQVKMLPGNYDGIGYGVPDWDDPRNFMTLPELSDGRSFYSVLSGISETDIPNDLREIHAYMNLLYLGDGGDIDLWIINGFAQKSTLEPLSLKYEDNMGHFMAIRFAPSDYNAVYNGYVDFMISSYTLESAVGRRGFDAERRMFYYPVVLIGSDGGNSAGVSIKLYYDEYGFHSPRPEDIKGVASGSDLEMKLAGIFGG